MMGTAKYLSPEQVRGRKLDGRADLYSLGLVLYECLAGRVPFLGETDADTALARLQRDPTDLARLRPTLPYGLADADPPAARPQPEDRPATGADRQGAQLPAVADDPAHRPHPRPAPRPTPSRGTPMSPGRPPPATGGYRPVAPRRGTPTTGPSAQHRRSVRTGRVRRRPDAPPDRTPHRTRARRRQHRNRPSSSAPAGSS